LNRKLSQERFSYYRCSSCELVFLSPVPANLGDYYPASYYAAPPPVEQAAPEADPERYKIEIVQRFMPGGRLLEVGPAFGAFASLAKRAGYEVEAIEMDARCCQYLTEVLGVRAINSADVCSTIRAAEPYNVIALWHNIEHLPDPWETLEAAASRLLPQGILVIATPNPAALQFRLLGRFWTHVDAPRHLQLIPAPLLLRRAEELGLKALMITAEDKGTLGWNTFGWRESLGNLFRRGSAKGVMRKVGNRISTLLGPVERSGFRGSAYTVVFQKGQ
jgi:2-polyprenyl-3-methyl-5-hydroxy-6-metoxy-1,4-benzoquinol methylase